MLGLPDETYAAERVPLGPERIELEDRYNDHPARVGRKRSGSRKGKERSLDDEEERGETVFSLGDEEDDK